MAGTNHSLEELETAQRTLMCRYLEVLEAVRRSSWIQLPSWVMKPVSWLIGPRLSAQHTRTMPLQPLVNLFVEGHIRKKLNELSKAYLALRVKAPADDEPLKKWAKESGELAEKMAGTLATWASVSGSFKLWWPLALSALFAWLGAKDIWDAMGKLDAKQYFIAYGVLVFPVIYMSIFMSSAFRRKRRLFLMTAEAESRESLDVADVESGDPNINLYMLEDRLFSLLGWEKSRETAWDIYLVSIGAFIFGTVPFGMYINGDQVDWYLWLSGGFFWVASIFALLGLRARLSQ